MASSPWAEVGDALLQARLLKAYTGVSPLRLSVVMLGGGWQSSIQFVGWESTTIRSLRTQVSSKSSHCAEFQHHVRIYAQVARKFGMKSSLLKMRIAGQEEMLPDSGILGALGLEHGVRLFVEDRA